MAPWFRVPAPREHTLGRVTAPAAIDWQRWLHRWDAQQQRMLPSREERFAVMTATLEAFAGPAPQVLDLGSGPGSLSDRVLQRLPRATVVAIDADPVLAAIARGAHVDEARISFVEADLRGDWVDTLPRTPPFDAAVSTTALHWLGLPDLVRFFWALAGVLRPGAVLLNGDRIDFDHDQRVIAEAAARVALPRSASADDAEDWDEWWRAVAEEPRLAREVEERRRRGYDHPHRQDPQTYEFFRAALLAAGFTEVGTLWQRLNDRVLVAVR